MGRCKIGNVLLNSQYGFKERTIKSKKELLKQIFNPIDVTSYDIFKTITFIVSWEFTEKYSNSPSIEEIRSGKDSHSILENKVRDIGEKLLQTF